MNADHGGAAVIAPVKACKQDVIITFNIFSLITENKCQSQRHQRLPPFHCRRLVPFLFQLLWLHLLSATTVVVISTIVTVCDAIYPCPWPPHLSLSTTTDAVHICSPLSSLSPSLLSSLLSSIVTIIVTTTTTTAIIVHCRRILVYP